MLYPEMISHIQDFSTFQSLIQYQAAQWSQKYKEFQFHRSSIE